MTEKEAIIANAICGAGGGFMLLGIVRDSWRYAAGGVLLYLLLISAIAISGASK